MRLLPALLAAALLAGCADAPAPVPASVPEEPLVVKDVRDVDVLENSSFNQRSHLHDYWQGRSTLPVLSVSVDQKAFVLREQWNWTYAPEEGQIVPQGTAFVNVTTTWTSQPTDQFGTPELWVQTAAQHQPTKIAELEQGVTVSVPVQLADTDIPHQPLSAWRFHFLVPAANGMGFVQFDGHVTMDAVAARGAEIPLFPPHPDVWDGRDAIPLFSAEVPLLVFNGDPTTESYNCLYSCPRLFRPDNGTTVPFDASFVEVRLRLDEPVLTTLDLVYHGADTREWQRAPDPAREDGALVYTIPVEALMGDSPYASQSVWEFVPVIEAPFRNGVFAGGYEIEGRVVK